MLQKPHSGEFPLYFSRYIDKCPTDILPYLLDQEKTFVNLLKSIPTEKWGYAYQAGKWTLKQSIIHLIETEKIFTYRSLVLSRKEKQNIPGFDQDQYVKNHDSSHLSPSYVIKDFIKTRQLTTHQFAGYNQEQWSYIGTVSGHPIINSALAYMIGGHVAHHIDIIKDRYL